MSDESQRVLKYIPSVAKALEVILWLADRQPGVDIYHLVKSTFYGDKYHVARFGRPIIGDLYRAAWFGPLPQVVYGLLRHEPMEILALGNSGPLPFRVDNAFRVYGERGPNLDRLSPSDVEALQHGLKEVAGKSFDELLELTHREPAYQRAASGIIDYRDLIPDDDPHKQEKVEYLEEVASIAVL